MVDAQGYEDVERMRQMFKDGAVKSVAASRDLSAQSSNNQIASSLPPLNQVTPLIRFTIKSLQSTATRGSDHAILGNGQTANAIRSGHHAVEVRTNNSNDQDNRTKDTRHSDRQYWRSPPQSSQHRHAKEHGEQEHGNWNAPQQAGIPNG